MLDRESTFAHPAIVKMLKKDFVPVAIDQAYQRRQKDTEGDFYRKIAGQSPRSNFQATTQGFYIATASGELLLYNNNRNPEKVAGLMRQKLDEFRRSRASKTTAKKLQTRTVDKRFNPKPPAGGLVVRVHAKILAGYKPTRDRWQRIFQTSMSRDNLWISAKEHRALVAGQFPRSLQERIARFHLVDNTRGEPPMWQPTEIRQLDIQLKSNVIQGSGHLETSDKSRGYEVDLLGEVASKNGRIVRFDLVAKGAFWGDGPYTKNAPEGRFPLAVSFSLADGSDVADQLPPQGSRGWVDGYIR